MKTLDNKPKIVSGKKRSPVKSKYCTLPPDECTCLRETRAGEQSAEKGKKNTCPICQKTNALQVYPSGSTKVRYCRFCDFARDEARDPVKESRYTPYRR